MAKSSAIPEIDLHNVPVHVGVIMDGNGRWAKKRGLPRKLGHREGVKTFRSITRRAKALGIKYITFYAFSTENWKRPQDEVNAIMDLFEKNLDEVKDFIDEEIRVRFIGDRSRLSPTLQEKMLNTEKSSEHFDGTTMILAINYGGQDEICHAARSLAEMVRDGKLSAENISPEIFSQQLYAPDIPPLDYIIRPSGEMRLSNFMIWQAAYAEYYFTDILWPDFKDEDFDKAIADFAGRGRRFGGVK